MGKVFVRFLDLQIDRPVLEFLRRRNINPNDVRSWRITRSAVDMPVIELTMFYDEREMSAEPDNKE